MMDFEGAVNALERFSLARESTFEHRPSLRVRERRTFLQST
jgi:hypothetical protein